MTTLQKKVEQLVKVLSEISRKLGMLSINASIEAARSGEAGRGFGIVASEINNLSITTSDNTKKATQILGEIRSAVTTGSKNVNGTVESFEDMTKGFKEIAKNQSEIRKKSLDYSKNLGNLDSLNSSISDKSKSIYENIMQRNSEITNLYQSLEGVSKTFHNISDNSEVLTSTGEFLQGLAKLLSSLVGKFKVQEKKPILT